MHIYKIKNIFTDMGEDDRLVIFKDVDEVRIKINGNLAGQVGFHLSNGKTITFDVEEKIYKQESLF